LPKREELMKETVKTLDTLEGFARGADRGGVLFADRCCLHPTRRTTSWQVLVGGNISGAETASLDGQNRTVGSVCDELQDAVSCRNF